MDTLTRPTTTTVTTGTPIAGQYMHRGQLVTDYTGTVTAVDFPDEHESEFILLTITFHGGRTEHYITDTNGHSVDTGMVPTPCPGPEHPVEPHRLTNH